MRFCGTCYRAHDPRWSFRPLSGEGAALHGGRFNPKGMPALYLSLDLMTAILEASHGLARKILPCVLCCYQVDCDDIADLASEAGRAEHGVDPQDMASAWFSDIAAGREPPSWTIARTLSGRNLAGAVVPSYARGGTGSNRNLVLWTWGGSPLHKVEVFDPSGRLPKSQLSWA